MLADFHMHTRFSVDSDADPEEMVLASIEKGLETICFTDHEEKDFFCDGKESLIDMAEYVPEILKLQEKYRDKIQVLLGAELSMQPHLGEYFKEYTRNYPFDFIIGSAHAARGIDPYFGKEYFDGLTDQEGYSLMFDEMMKDIQAIEDFDVLGHLDYVVRYGKNQSRDYSYHAFADQIDPILRYLVEHGKGLEVNTAGLKYGLPFAHPHPEVLKRYRELGGEIVTVGADAHKPEHIAYAFDQVNDILTECGFKYYTEFVERHPVFKKIC